MINKKLILLLAFLLIFVFILRFVLGGAEDTWICSQGQWVKHGQPNSPKPTSICQ